MVCHEASHGIERRREIENEKTESAEEKIERPYKERIIENNSGKKEREKGVNLTSFISH